MNSLILSAGLGTRFRPQTDRIAKAALPFLNVPMLGYSLSYAEDLEPDTITFNLHHLPDTVKAAVTAATTNVNYSVAYTLEHPIILDSGGGIGFARRHLSGDGDFAVLNADSIFLLAHAHGLLPLIEKHWSTGALATLLVCDAKGCGENFSGVWTDKNGAVRDFGVHPGRKDLKPLHYVGAMILSDEILKYIPDGISKIFGDVMTAAIADGHFVNTHREDDLLWFETGNLVDYNIAQRRCLEILSGPDSIYKANLQKILKRHLGAAGVRLREPDIQSLP